MKGAVLFLLVASIIAAVSEAVPVQPDVTSEVDNVHAHVPDGPVVEEKDSSGEEVWIRRRRLANPGDSRGSVGASIDEERGKGVKLTLDADRTLWKSDDGKTRLDVSGEWSKYIDGPAKSKSDVAGFLKFSHDLP